MEGKTSVSRAILSRSDEKISMIEHDSYKDRTI